MSETNRNEPPGPVLVTAPPPRHARQRRTTMPPVPTPEPTEEGAPERSEAPEPTAHPKAANG